MRASPSIDARLYRAARDDRRCAVSGHTPGPWAWNEKYRGLEGDNGECPILVYERFEGMWLAPGCYEKGNARLIAAAPDLLAALEEATRDLELSGYAWDHPFLGKLRATIAKATGVPP